MAKHIWDVKQPTELTQTGLRNLYDYLLANGWGYIEARRVTVWLFERARQTNGTRYFDRVYLGDMRYAPPAYHARYTLSQLDYLWPIWQRQALQRAAYVAARSRKTWLYDVRLDGAFEWLLGVSISGVERAKERDRRYREACVAAG